MLTLLNQLTNIDTLQSAVCFVCAQLHTWVQCWTQIHGEAWPNFKSQAPIRWLKVRDSLLAWEDLDTHMFLRTFDVSRFNNMLAAENEAYDNPFSNASELKIGDTEWQRKLLINETMWPFGLSFVPKMSMPGKVDVANTKMKSYVVSVRSRYVPNVKANGVPGKITKYRCVWATIISGGILPT